MNFFDYFFFRLVAQVEKKTDPQMKSSGSSQASQDDSPQDTWFETVLALCY